MKSQKLTRVAIIETTCPSKAGGHVSHGTEGHFTAILHFPALCYAFSMACLGMPWVFLVSYFSFSISGLQQQGIFRVPGSQVEVNDIKNSFERGGFAGEEVFSNCFYFFNSLACVRKDYVTINITDVLFDTKISNWYRHKSKNTFNRIWIHS